MRPGRVVVRETDHEPFTVFGERYVVRELVWNGIPGRSYELVRLADDVVLTEDESFNEYPTGEQIAAVLNDHGSDVKAATSAELVDASHLESLARNARSVDDLFAEWALDPQMRSEMEARDAVRTYRRVEVYVRNVITRGVVRNSKAAWESSSGSGFVQEFEDLDDARRFAEDNRFFFNNCRVRASYVAGYETRIEKVCACPHSWHAPMVDAEVTYSVWRAVPGWETGEPETHRHEHVHHTKRSPAAQTAPGRDSDGDRQSR